MQVEVDGATLHVEIDGSADNPALLLWPPGSCTVRVWDHYIPVLSERFQVVRIDIRGWGESSPAADPAQYTLEQYAQDACDVLDHLGIERCHVWSQSWGTRPNIVFCAFNPERVISAALYAANTDLPDQPAQREGSIRAAEERRKLGIKTMKAAKGFNVHKHPEAASVVAKALRKFDLSKVIDKLTMPVLIGTGSEDPNLVSSRVIARTAPNAKLVEFPAVGHNSILEHPDLALETFLEFQDSL